MRGYAADVADRNFSRGDAVLYICVKKFDFYFLYINIFFFFLSSDKHKTSSSTI